MFHSLLVLLRAIAIRILPNANHPEQETLITIQLSDTHEGGIGDFTSDAYSVFTFSRTIKPSTTDRLRGCIAHGLPTIALLNVHEACFHALQES